MQSQHCGLEIPSKVTVVSQPSEWIVAATEHGTKPTEGGGAVDPATVETIGHQVPV